MLRTVLCVCLLAFTSATPASCAQSRSLAFTHVTLIDGTGSEPKPDTTVLIEGKRIVAVGSSMRTRPPAGAEIVDGTGRFLIPGLWDMHVHLGSYDDGKRTLQLLLAGGVTGVRDMASPLADALRLRRETGNGAILGPEIVTAGPILQGRLPFEMPPLVRMVSPEDAAPAVDDLKSAGVDFIKVGDTLPRESYMRIAEEARRLNVPFAGHLTPFVSANEAVAAGQRSVEHFGGAGFRTLLIATSTDESALSAFAQAALADALNGGESPDVKVYRAEFTQRLVDTYSTAKAAALFAAMVKRGTRLTPTFVAIQDVWMSQRAKLSPADAAASDHAAEQTRVMFRQAKHAEVSLLAGSDRALRDGVAPIHAELEALVSAGLTPMEALQSATREPAGFFGRLRTEGTVERGKLANIVLLEANPLEDIRNTQGVAVVFVRGRMIRPSKLRTSSNAR
jgi:imidazolonepropionase-like amidohydrolase